MAFCSKCGVELPQGSAFCASCGQATGAPAPSSAASTLGTGAELNMQKNVAGLLCYAFWWVTGLIFFFIDKRPFVRFHAAQSIVVFGGLQIVHAILARMFVGSFWYGGFAFASMSGLLLTAVNLLELVLWIVLMVKAYQGEMFRVPLAADLADQIAGKVSGAV